MELIIDNIASLVAEDKGIFGGNKVTERTYVLPDNDKSYAIMFQIAADGTAAYSARPMPGTANFVESKCK